MTPILRFGTFIFVSVIVFLWLIRFTLRSRDVKPDSRSVFTVTGVVVVGGMMFAKFGNNFGLPWWIYYTLPALLTMLLPPLAFRMKGAEVGQYFVLAFLSSPIIHSVFSLFLGWKEYMPFIPIPSLQELLR